MPPEDLRKAVLALHALSPRLNAITDVANLTVREVEAFLNEELSIGVPAFVKFYEDPDGDGGKFLEYRRVGTRFRIAVVDHYEGVDRQIRAWADCTRDEKLNSFAKLPDLLTAIAANVASQLRETEEAAQAVAASMTGLRKPVPVPPATSSAAPASAPRQPSPSRRSLPYAPFQPHPPLNDSSDDIPF